MLVIIGAAGVAAGKDLTATLTHCVAFFSRKKILRASPSYHPAEKIYILMIFKISEIVP